MPPGTLYTEYWMDSDRECLKLIDDFKSSPEIFFDTSDLMIYYDNSASLVLEGMEYDDEIVLTDVNVVGDADPAHTLRVVFDEDALDDVVSIRGSEYNEVNEWDKKKLLLIANELRNDPDVGTEFEDWVMGRLNELSSQGNTIIDVELEAII